MERILGDKIHFLILQYIQNPEYIFQYWKGIRDLSLELGILEFDRRLDFIPILRTLFRV
ncbi:hypothetical protein LEP1GSC037_0015 [Leptospira interrogans str. 2006001854]|uniref:Uncharacterized protein n=1 Tax=Leptospira interrogans str. 2006001854 TaxID=1001590 RepID=M6GDZ2_LEPIR|nr:hypothetical protein LEP1GSC037_0015 [Leptospira interrogans str. 2006001854]